MTEAILRIRNLRTYFFTRRGIVKAVDGIDFDLRKSECLCLVGESGCGKTVTALSILNLVDSPPGRVVSGEIYYDSLNLLKCPPDQIRRIRGKEIAMVFQDAQSALNPVFTIGDQIAEQVKLRPEVNQREAKEQVINLLKEVGMPIPEKMIGYYPHQLSGGMRQRAMIAMSLSGDPQILIADEPTTAVDVTVKGQILDIFSQLKSTRQMSLLFITHELGIVSEIGDRIMVMYGGKIVETATVSELLNNPKHPYTISLIKCLPDITQVMGRLESIPGTVPSLINPPSGCLFHPRCDKAMAVCSKEEPPPFIVAEGRTVFCHLYSRPER
ncbi:MAG: peptide ABC transporter ATP-binding protein [Dehalococcoidales bacterium]|nr:peptide ABC transporter ATP-binding protein [Dehalococcoidales bacterium]|tara:strand:+ start:277 stop:1257 length:981 start_codon:yes stop_codon:yes gene_type:complete